MSREEFAKKLLDAHVQHEMERLTGDNSESALAEEVGHIYDWVGSLKVHQIVNREKILELILSEVRSSAGTEEALLLGHKIGEKVLQIASSSKDTIETLVSREGHDRWVDVLISSKDLRTGVAHDFAQSLFFKRIISEVLVFSIRGFLSEDNILAKSIPGMSSLFKFGQNIVNKTLPGMDENVSRVVREFISKNIDGVSKYTESVMNSQMDEKLIKELADDFRNDMAKRPLAKLATDLGQIQAEQVNAAARATWNHFRTTEFCTEMIRGVVHTAFDHAGDRNVSELLNAGGWSRDKLAQAISSFVAPFLRESSGDGRLESLIRNRLSSFYNSDAAISLYPT